MVIKFLMRYLVNNTEMIEKMANSYPIRRAAQLTMYIFHRSKSALEDPRTVEYRQKILEQVKQATGDNPAQRLKEFPSKFVRELKKEWEKGRGGGSERK